MLNKKNIMSHPNEFRPITIAVKTKNRPVLLDQLSLLIPQPEEQIEATQLLSFVKLLEDISNPVLARFFFEALTIYVHQHHITHDGLTYFAKQCSTSTLKQEELVEIFNSLARMYLVTEQYKMYFTK